MQLQLSAGTEFSRIREPDNMWGYRIIETNDYSPLITIGAGIYLSRIIILKWQIQGSFKNVKAVDGGSRPLEAIVFNKFSYSVLTSVAIIRFLRFTIGPCVYDIPSMKQVGYNVVGQRFNTNETFIGVYSGIEGIYKNVSITFGSELPISYISSKENSIRGFMKPIKSFQLSIGYTLNLQ